MSKSTKYMLANMQSNLSETKNDTGESVSVESELKSAKPELLSKPGLEMDKVLANCLAPRKGEPKLTPNS
jgi:hypothetical protein